MTLQTAIDAINQLAPKDREELRTMLNDMADRGDDLTDAQKAEFLRRRDANRADPSRLIPREAVSARLKERHKP